MDRLLNLRRSVLLLLVVALVGLSPIGSSPAGASSNWIDTRDRDAVVAAYQNEFGGSEPGSGWTGNRSTCDAGQTSQAYRNAIFGRVNYFRSMAGVPAGVTENPTWSAMAQEAALMMSASGRLSHSPDNSFSCYSSNGATAAASSDLYLGRTGPAAITGYIQDPGSNNQRVGHRNWILHPTTTRMGTGDIPSTGGAWSSNSLWVFDNVFGSQPQLRESQGFVAWPPRGYVPGELVFPRWSVSIRNGDFSNASVSVTHNGAAVSSNVVHRDGASGGAPFPIIVWEPQGVNLSPAVDAKYKVNVTGVKVNGVSTSFTYDVVIVGDVAGAVLSPAQFEDFVTRSYQDFIGRAPNSSELEYWTNRLADGLRRFDFVQALANSDAWTNKVVDELFLDTLGRPADPGGRTYWAGRLQAGTPVAQVAASFYGSNEYVALQGGSYSPWVADLYAVLLNRSADPSGQNYWTAKAGQIGSGVVAYRFYQSQESREARVVALYQKFLDRSPDASGLAYWANVLRSGDDLRLAAFLAASDEYFVD